MAQPATQQRQAERDQLIGHLRESREKYLRSLQGVSEQAARFHAAADRWSILECAEHIAVAERQMFALWEKTATPGEADPANDARIIAGAQDRSTKAKAPERSIPTGRFASLAEATENFKLNRERTLAYLQQTGDDLRAKVVVHPLESRLDGYQLFLLMAFHALRHTAQIEEIKSDPAFPAGG